jgi:DNA invertase Pin-like site-specific DNA recombinase
LNLGKGVVKSPKKAPTVGATNWKLGYARVSTQDQNLSMQEQALADFGCQHIFREKVSGAKAKRPELARLWRELRPGDTLVVWKLDRLGRDLRDLLNRIHELGERGVRFVSLRDNIDTETPVGRLIFAIVGAIAQFERELTAERTRAGIAARKKRGPVHDAWTPKFDRDKVRKLLADGWTTAEVADKYRVTKSAIYKAIPADEREKLFIAAQRRKKRKR